MAQLFELNAENRTTTGKAAARRMRRDEGKVPAVVYGAGKEPQSITLLHNEISQALNYEAVYSHILTLKIDGKSEQVVLKNLLRHSTKPRIMHVDFLRVKAKEKITMKVPLHYLGEEEAPGVKEGGVVSKLMTELEISCLPAHLPESIDIDISKLELDQSLHLSDIKLPSQVELAAGEIDEEHDQAIVNVHIPRVVEEPEEAPAEEEAAEGEAVEGEGEEAAADETKAEDSKDEGKKED